jgi:hypothetical protein
MRYVRSFFVISVEFVPVHFCSSEGDIFSVLVLTAGCDCLCIRYVSVCLCEEIIRSQNSDPDEGHTACHSSQGRDHITTFKTENAKKNL